MLAAEHPRRWTDERAVKIVRRLILFLLPAFAAGVVLVLVRPIREHETPVRIDVVSGGASALRFRFSYCDRRGIPALHIVEVFQHSGAGLKEECLMSGVDGIDRPLEEWRIGTSVAGFRHPQGCESLGPGDYRVSASGAGTFGSATFRLSANGVVTPTSSPCG